MSRKPRQHKSRPRRRPPLYPGEMYREGAEKYTGLTRYTVYDYASRKLIPCYKRDGPDLIFYGPALDAWADLRAQAHALSPEEYSKRLADLFKLRGEPTPATQGAE